MKRRTVIGMVAMLLLLPSLGSANPNGVGEGTFDAQCGGACHGDADMNRSSMSVVSVNAPAVAYEGLLTSVAVTVSNIETTQTGLLGVFLLTDLNGAGDTPEDDGWTIVSNSEGGTQNYVEVTVEPGENEHTVTWTLRTPVVGAYAFYGAIHHGSQDGSEAPFFGASGAPAGIDVQPVPENLPRLDEAFEPPTQRTVGESRPASNWTRDLSTPLWLNGVWLEAKSVPSRPSHWKTGVGRLSYLQAFSPRWWSGVFT